MSTLNAHEISLMPNIAYLLHDILKYSSDDNETVHNSCCQHLSESQLCALVIDHADYCARA